MSGIDNFGLIEFKQQAKKGLPFRLGTPAERLDDIEDKIDHLASWLSEVDEKLARGSLNKSEGNK